MDDNGANGFGLTLTLNSNQFCRILNKNDGIYFETIILNMNLQIKLQITFLFYFSKLHDQIILVKT